MRFGHLNVYLDLDWVFHFEAYNPMDDAGESVQYPALWFIRQSKRIEKSEFTAKVYYEFSWMPGQFKSLYVAREEQTQALAYLRGLIDGFQHGSHKYL